MEKEKSLEDICEYAKEDTWYPGKLYCSHCNVRDNVCFKAKIPYSYKRCRVYQILKDKENDKYEPSR